MAIMRTVLPAIRTVPSARQSISPVKNQSSPNQFTRLAPLSIKDGVAIKKAVILSQSNGLQNGLVQQNTGPNVLLMSQMHEIVGAALHGKGEGFKKEVAHKVAAAAVATVENHPTDRATGKILLGVGAFVTVFTGLSMYLEHSLISLVPFLGIAVPAYIVASLAHRSRSRKITNKANKIIMAAHSESVKMAKEQQQ